MPRPLRRNEAYRRLAALGALACVAAAALVELMALQRSRYQLWRGRHQRAAHH